VHRGGWGHGGVRPLLLVKKTPLLTFQSHAVLLYAKLSKRVIVFIPLTSRPLTFFESRGRGWLALNSVLIVLMRFASKYETGGSLMDWRSLWVGDRAGSNPVHLIIMFI
jgi:hypothetical protein